MPDPDEESRPKHRGRKSAAELSVVPGLPWQQIEKPDPPEELSEEEAKIWKQSVSGMKASWFNPASEALLQAYCLQTTLGQQIARELRGVDIKTNYTRYAKLSRLHRDCSRSMMQLAVKLRIAPSSNRATVDGREHPSRRYPRPWEDSSDPA
jgi:phage terminase small subunit